jgi:dUTP pyrophosphatase
MSESQNYVHIPTTTTNKEPNTVETVSTTTFYPMPQLQMQPPINWSISMTTPYIPPTLKVKRLVEGAKLPTIANPGDLGYDLYATEDVLVDAGSGTTLVSTGIGCNFPTGYGALIRDRSGMAVKTSIFVVAGVIDNGYTGEIKVAFKNLGTPYQIKAGDKIAQMVLVPVSAKFEVVPVDELDTTARGTNGFGSSGR